MPIPARFDTTRLTPAQSLRSRRRRAPRVVATLAATIAAGATLFPTPSDACEGPGGTLGVSRVVEIDTASGPLFGKITKQKREDDFLKPKEVVLTFDDGPVPWITDPILKTLKAHCTKATFFSVGKMAQAYPKTTRAIVEAGHTLAGHTWSHPSNLPRMPKEKAIAQIERGFAALAETAGGEVAPFFRFPGLNDSGPLLEYLQARGIAAFTVDVVSDDSFIDDVDELVQTTLQRIKAHNGGIVLFHDIKPATAKALPAILEHLHQHGYSIVHLKAREHVELDPAFASKHVATHTQAHSASEEKNDAIAKGDVDGQDKEGRAPLLPFYGAVILERALDPDLVGRPITRLRPTARDRANRVSPKPKNKESDTGRKAVTAPPARPNALTTGITRTSTPADDQVPPPPPATANEIMGPPPTPRRP